MLKQKASFNLIFSPEWKHFKYIFICVYIYIHIILFISLYFKSSFNDHVTQVSSVTLIKEEWSNNQLVKFCEWSSVSFKSGNICGTEKIIVKTSVLL